MQLYLESGLLQSPLFHLRIVHAQDGLQQRVQRSSQRLAALSVSPADTLISHMLVLGCVHCRVKEVHYR